MLLNNVLMIFLLCVNINLIKVKLQQWYMSVYNIFKNIFTYTIQQWWFLIKAERGCGEKYFSIIKT